MIIDCDTCRVRGPSCADCVVTVLLGTPTLPVELDESEREAVHALAASGLVPPLRLVAVRCAAAEEPPDEDGVRTA